MHDIHTTPGFIIETRPTGEAGKVLSIFTRDHGLVVATAQGIRLEKSKLRYFAREYSFGTFSLVRGKEFWRLTGAAEGFSFRGRGLLERAEIASPEGSPSVARTLGTDAISRASSAGRRNENPSAVSELIARIALLLKRLLHGEEAHPELFAYVESCARFLQESLELNAEQLSTLESITVFRILHALGYIGADRKFAALIDSRDITMAMLAEMSCMRNAMNLHINKALRESHL